ncbi:hypothetical protein [Clostridium botulinum]|nr:hypothetical protein [Clostridium botulinum]
MQTLIKNYSFENKLIKDIYLSVKESVTDNKKIQKLYSNERNISKSVVIK